MNYREQSCNNWAKYIVEPGWEEKYYFPIIEIEN